jgi:hypothetical protein
MIISIGAILYGTVTYFRHERWDEYLSLIDTLKISSNRVVEISLANYTITLNSNILRSNLNKWRIDVAKAYGGYGIVVDPTIENDAHQVYNLNISYTSGLNKTWYNNVAFSAANVTIRMNITSIGLAGYTFISAPFVRVEILSAVYSVAKDNLKVQLTVEKEGLLPIPNLPKSSFLLFADISGQWHHLNLTRDPSYFYDSDLNRFIYELYSDDDNLGSQPSEISVVVMETRNIKVIANSTQIE